MYKNAEEIRKGDIVQVADKEQTVKKVTKLFNPGNRLQIINVSLVLQDRAMMGSIAVFPPTEKVEVDV